MKSHVEKAEYDDKCLRDCALKKYSEWLGGGGGGGGAAPQLQNLDKD